MIIIGYQGIGKSTLAHKSKGYVDLESASFWHHGKRPDNWYVYYCNIAEHLSKQGFVVFVSSHEVVRNRIRKYCKERAVCIYPSIHLRDEWCEKLKERYRSMPIEKNYKAWMNAEERYKENIAEIMMCGILHAEIDSLQYDLEKMIQGIIERNPDIEWNARQVLEGRHETDSRL